jgi:hypothetical protein
MPIAWAVCLAAALAPSGLSAPSASYFPLSQGAAWTLRNRTGQETRGVVVGRKTIRGTACTVQEGTSVREGRELVVWNCYAATAREVLLLETGVPIRMIAIDPPRPILVLPPASGKSWTWAPKDRPRELTAYEWMREETVRVPAGTFKAWRLQTTRTRANRTTVVYSWYAGGVGLVKFDTVTGPGEQARERGSELISYRIP